MFTSKRLLWFEFMVVNHNYATYESIVNHKDKTFTAKILPFDVSATVPIKDSIERVQSKAEYELIRIWGEKYPLGKSEFDKFLHNKVKRGINILCQTII